MCTPAEVGRVVPLQNRTRDNSYPIFGTPVSYPLLQDVCQVVPATGRTRDGSYPETRTLFQYYQYFNFFTLQLVWKIIHEYEMVNLYKNSVRLGSQKIRVRLVAGTTLRGYDLTSIPPMRTNTEKDS